MPLIDVVVKSVSAWNSRNLSYGGRALISNGLALSRVWYMATMLPIPGWAVGKLNRIIFPFFWKGENDLVSRAVVIQFRSCGGFGIVATHLKSQALLLQWIKRFWASSYGWRLFLVYWTQSVFRVSPAEVFASPFSFNLKRLLSFYAAVLDAWRAVDGHASVDLSHLFIERPTGQVPVSNITCKSYYDLVLDANRRRAHCELKFRPFFVTLYWPSTWKQVHIMSLDRPVIDLCWRVSHGVLYTAERLVGFGYNIVPNCICGHLLETLYHLFFFWCLAVPEWYLMGLVSALSGYAFGTHPANSPSSFWFLQR